MLYLIDGNSYLYRAFYALPPMVNAHGQGTNAVLGFTKMLRNILKNKDLTNLIIIFDWPNASFSRKEKFKDYKIQRQKMPEGLIGQKEIVKEILAILRITVIELPNVEADDVIGSLTHKFSNQGIKILSSDKDMCQLITNSVSVYDGMKNIIIDKKQTFIKMGVYPEQIIDLLSLMGDASDNIPGVKWIWPKTAIKLLADFKSLNWIYTNIEQIKGTTQKKLINSQKMAFLSYDLATIRTDINCNINLEETKYNENNLQKDSIKKSLLEIFNRLEFSRILKEFNLEKTKLLKNNNLSLNKVIILKNKKKIDQLLNYLQNWSEFYFSFHQNNNNNFILISYNKELFSFSLLENKLTIQKYFLNNILDLLEKNCSKLTIFDHKASLTKIQKLLKEITKKTEQKKQIRFWF